MFCIEKQATVADTLRLFDRINQGKFFSCEFIKNDGSIRTMVCRTHVKKYVTGGHLKFNPKSKGLLPVWDCQKREYRFVNLNTLNWVRLGNVRYIFNPDNHE